MVCIGLAFSTNFIPLDDAEDHLDWVVSCKLLLAPFKGFNFGSGLLAKLEDFVQASGSLAFEQFIEWTEAALKGDSAKVDWLQNDGPLLIQRYFQFVTQLLLATLGSTTAKNHELVAAQFMAAHKAEGRFKVHWAIPVMYRKHAHLLRVYHNTCISWVTESAFFYDMYGQDLLWDHPGTDSRG